MKAILIWLVLLGLSLAAFAQLDTVWTSCLEFEDYVTGYSQVIPLADEQFVACGYRLGGNYLDAIVARFDANGDTLWTRAWGDLEDDAARLITPLADGRFLVCGTTDAPTRTGCLLYTVLNPDGTLRSTLDFSTGDLSGAIAAKRTPDSGAIVLGRWYDFGPRLYVLRVAPNGDTLSIERVTDAYYELDFVPAADGWIGVEQWGDSLRLVRINDDGQPMWTRYVAGYSGAEWPRIRASLDGGYLLAFTIHRFGGQEDVHVLRLDGVGDTVWDRVVGSVSHGNPITDMAVNWQDGWILLCGSIFGRDLALLEANGDTVWTRSIAGGYAASRIAAFNSQHIVIAGGGPDNPGPCLVKLHFNLGVSSREPVVGALALSSYPNPFNPTATISLTIPQTARTTVTVYDVLGRAVRTLQEGVLERGEHTLAFDGGALPSGLYFARVVSGEFVATTKMLMLK